MKKIVFLILTIFLGSICVGHANGNSSVDYARTENWLSLPTVADKGVDVFYLYPTVFHKTDNNEANICNIDNEIMRSGAKMALKVQASAFANTGNIYAPYYRQVDAAYCLSLPLEEQRKVLESQPMPDVLAAFDYYIKNYNNGRPFMLAGHSQGSNLLLYLLSDYMKVHPDVYARMVAAYVIGYSITDDYLASNPHLKFAKGADDTGVIISYNTEAPEIRGINPVVLPGAIVINPITWTRDETLATAEESLGSLMPNSEGKVSKVDHYADARVDKAKGVVICSTADADYLYSLSSSKVFGKGIYHGFDYFFYYYSNFAVNISS